MAYDLIIKFDGLEQDHPVIRSVIRQITELNLIGDVRCWERFGLIVEQLARAQLMGDIVPLGVRLEITTRYDRVKPRIKSKKS